MDNFKLIYKILKILDKYKGREDFDPSLVSAQALHSDFACWESIMIELQNEGYIRGLVCTQTQANMYSHIVEPIHPAITLKGMKYLAENGMMAKAKEALKLVGDIL